MAMGSCRREKFFTGSTSLQPSRDTIWFDTLFTKHSGSGYPLSVTKMFSFKNREKTTVKANFRLGGGKNSAYRFNVDGVAGPEITNLEIPGKDSVFVFVQCTLEANNLTQPAIVLDSLLSTVNGKEGKVLLAAYGWDAHYVRDSVLPCGGVWSDKVKPYVVIDNVLVDSLCTFTIKEGVNVYCSARSRFFVAGALRIEGTTAERVRFTGDKPVYNARFLPNQWVGIHFLRGNANSLIRYADIHNAAIGLRVDSLPVGGPFNLTLENTSVKYCGQVCLAGITAKVQATNCLFAEAGSYTFLGLLGGNYSFRHCTFAGYVYYGARQDGHFAITNTLRDGNGAILDSRDLSCTAYNCIIDGGNKEELAIDNAGAAAFATDFQSCLIRSKSQPFAGMIYNRDIRFKDMLRSNYALDTLSPAIDAGMVLSPAISVDLKGDLRDGSPDVGAFEFKK
ncbi:MAG: hypothetical protein JNL57_02565 [Bacteroidetes bacterium]|nr:hypothetical protein [Bacteroidota bacterium]